MYYKIIPQNADIDSLLRNNKSLEYAIALQEKYEKVNNSKIFKAVKDNEIDYFVVYNDIQDFYIVEKYKTYKRIELNKDIKEALGFDSFTDITDDVLSEQKNFNQKNYEFIKNKLENYFVLKEEGTIYDKNGDKYTYKIIENAVNRSANNVIMDVINIYNENGKQIGYLNAQYSTKEISLYCSDEITSAEYNEPLINAKNPSRAQKMDFLERHSTEYTNQNIDTLFKLKQKEIKLKINDFDKSLVGFDNIASIDYSYLEESTRGKEIAKDMYLKMGLYLKNKGISFRSSSLRSKYAESFWVKLQKGNPELVKKYETNDFLNGCYYLDLKGTESNLLNNPYKKVKNTNKSSNLVSLFLLSIMSISVFDKSEAGESVSNLQIGITIAASCEVNNYVKNDKYYIEDNNCNGVNDFIIKEELVNKSKNLDSKTKVTLYW